MIELHYSQKCPFNSKIEINDDICWYHCENRIDYDFNSGMLSCKNLPECRPDVERVRRMTYAYFYSHPEKNPANYDGDGLHKYYGETSDYVENHIERR